jgi:hypothetical protein
MFECRSLAAARASRKKRSRADSSPRYRSLMTLSVTGQDFVTKYYERNPGKEVLYFNYAATDPVLTNDKCSFWHFRWDANSDIKMEALTNYMKGIVSIKKLYLINQDWSFGESVRSQARAMLAAKRPDIQIVGDELHPLLKITMRASKCSAPSSDFRSADGSASGQRCWSRPCWQG